MTPFQEWSKLPLRNRPILMQSRALLRNQPTISAFLASRTTSQINFCSYNCFSPQCSLKALSLGIFASQSFTLIVTGAPGKGRNKSMLFLYFAFSHNLLFCLMNTVSSSCVFWKVKEYTSLTSFTDHTISSGINHPLPTSIGSTAFFL